MTAPILILPPIKWEFSKETKIDSQSTKLGDGYALKAINPNSIRDVYDVTIPNLTASAKNEIVFTLSQYGGFVRFRWRPFDTFPYKEYCCDKWAVIRQGTYLWQITATFTEQK